MPALLLSLLVLPILFSCSRDKGNDGATAPRETPVVERQAAQDQQEEIVPNTQPTANDEPEPAAPARDDAGLVEPVRTVEPATVARASAEPEPADEEDPFEARMGRREGGHFLVKFEGGENSVAGHLIGLLLEEAYLKVGSDLGHYPEERIEALLYSREAFRDITRSPAWAGAIYDGRIKLPAGGITEKTSALEKVIYHEYTHAVVKELSRGRAPVWLNEGIAQYEEGQSTAPYARALSGLASKGRLRLRPLEGSFMRLRAQEAQAAYILSLSAAEYIIREFGLFSVRSILERLGEGMSIDEAVSASLGISYEDLEKRWAASLSGD